MALAPHSLMRAGLVVGVATAISRILGFARDILIAAALGAGPVADALLVALRLPNLARKVLGEGGVNAGFVPLQARLAAERGEAAAAEFAGRAVSTASLALLALAILMHLGAGALVLAMASGYAGEGGDFALARDLTRLALPSVALMTLAALVAAILNAQRRFVAASLAPFAVNLALIAALVAPSARLSADPVLLARILAFAFSLGALAQLVFLVLALRRASPDLRLRRPRLDADMRRLATIGLPGLLAASASQLILLAAFQAASYTPSAVSHLHYADRLFQLPLGLIGVAAGIVLLPEIATRLRAGDHEGLRAATDAALAGSMLLALPAAAALLILAEPMTGVLFERGAFTAADRLGTAAILAGLACGLPFAVAAKVLGQGLFAAERMRAANLAGLAGILAAGIACALLAAWVGPVGIGLGAALGFATQAAAIGAALWADRAWRPGRPLILRLSRIATATLVMSAGLVALCASIEQWSAPLLAGACLGGLGLYATAGVLTGAVTRADLARLRRRG